MPEVLSANHPEEASSASGPVDVIPVEQTGGNWPDENRPSPLKRAAFKVIFKWMMKVIVLILFLPCVGVGLIVQSAESISHLANQEPRNRSCQDLIENGASDGEHIVLTDFRMRSDLLLRNLLSPDEHSWSRAYALVVPAEEPERQSAIRVFVETEQAKTRAQLDELARSGRIQGTISRGTGNLTFRDTVRLQMKVPKTDLHNCYFLRHGNVPPSPLKTYVLLGLGIVLLVVGLAIWCGVWWLWRLGRKA